MFKRTLPTGLIVAVFISAGLTGCQKSDGDPKTAGKRQQPSQDASSKVPGGKSDSEGAAGVRDSADGTRNPTTANDGQRAERQASAVTPIEPAKLIPAEMPEVVLSEAHAASSTVKVGDAFPDADLARADGKSQSVSSLLGKRLTVVAFWTSKEPYAVEELADLSRSIAAPYSGYGLTVIGINEGDSASDVQSTATDKEVVFPMLLDDQGKLLSQVATEKLPRTYLLDADGKVLWFDLEYSRTTRRDLLAAIRSQLSDEKTAAR